MDTCRECGAVNGFAGAHVDGGLCEQLTCHRRALADAEDQAIRWQDYVVQANSEIEKVRADLGQAQETRDAAQAEATRQTLLAREANDRLTAYMKDQGSSSRLDVALGSLRHAYVQASQCRIGNQDDFAEGLLAPAIRLLEQFQRYEVKS